MNGHAVKIIRVKLLMLAWVWLLCWVVCSAQEYPRKEIDLERLIDEIYPIQDLDINYEDLYENLAQILANPLDLNTVSQEQLRSLYVLSEEQINSFLVYRKQNSPLLSVYELQSVPLFDERAINKLLYFVIVKDTGILNKSLASRIIRNPNNYLVLRMERTLEKKKGYASEADSTSRYIGSQSPPIKYRSTCWPSQY